MTQEVFVDAAAWVAVADRGDARHEAAVACHRRLLTERWRLVTTNLVVAETHALILRYGSYRAAMGFLESMRPTLHLVKVFEDEALEAEAEAILRRYSDQDFSLTDAVSFAVMRQRGIEQAFTFDSHFATAGFVIVPAA
jgi:hypothetical protein